MAKWKQDSSGNWKKSSSSKKNYTIVDGKKVENSSINDAKSSGISDSWQKETITPGQLQNMYRNPLSIKFKL